MNTMFPIHLLCSSYKSIGRGSGERGGGFQQALRSSRGCGAVKTDRPHPRTAGRREGGREGGRDGGREESLPQASRQEDDGKPSRGADETHVAAAAAAGRGGVWGAGGGGEK